MGIAPSPPKSGRDAPCHARNRGAQASILSSVLALGMAFDTRLRGQTDLQTQVENSVSSA